MLTDTADATGFRVMLAEDDFVGSASLVALIVTTNCTGTEDGAV